MSYKPELTDEEKREQKELDCYRQAAFKRQKDGEIEFDADAIVSHGNDGGAYVQAWVWIGDDEAGVKAAELEQHRLYECGICDSLHPWEWDGDCREDRNRYADEAEYCERNGLDIPLHEIEVFSWEDRQAADKEAK